MQHRHQSPLRNILSSLSPEQWSICVSAVAILGVVLIANIAVKKARRWLILTDIKSDVVSEDFFNLRDLSRVSLSPVFFFLLGGELSF